MCDTKDTGSQLVGLRRAIFLIFLEILAEGVFSILSKFHLCVAIREFEIGDRSCKHKGCQIPVPAQRRIER